MKQKFCDAIKIRYKGPLKRISSQSICGASFDVTQALACKEGGFMTLRHNEVRDKSSELLNEVMSQCEKEPILQEVNNENLPLEAISDEEKIIKLNFYFHTLLWCLKRFYEGL